jgi:UDP-glucose 4-epimerase
MEAILITGGAGYIGSHAVRVLAERGYRPVVLDDFSTGHREFVKNIDHVEGNIADRALIESTLARYKIQSVMHFASFINVGDSVANPGEYYTNNVAGGISLIDTIRRYGIKSFVFSSTCAVYGQLTKPETLNEDATIGPLNPYAQAKRMIEIVLEDHCRAHDFNAVAFRYFNASGACEKYEIGEWHEPETHLIPNMIRAAHAGGQLDIYGDDYEIPGRDGTAVRDYIHVLDLVEAHVLGLEYLKSHRGFSVFNLGTGTGASVIEMLNTAKTVLGKEIHHTIRPRRAGDAPYLVANSQKARDILKWEPKHSDLENILRTADQWEKQLAAIKNSNQ